MDLFEEYVNDRTELKKITQEKVIKALGENYE